MPGGSIQCAESVAGQNYEREAGSQMEGGQISLNYVYVNIWRRIKLLPQNRQHIGIVIQPVDCASSLRQGDQHSTGAAAQFEDSSPLLPGQIEPKGQVISVVAIVSVIEQREYFYLAADLTIQQYSAILFR